MWRLMLILSICPKFMIFHEIVIAAIMRENSDTHFSEIGLFPAIYAK